MISDSQISTAIGNVLKTINIPELGKKISGKVRDFYIKNNERILITTDRQSAFDINIGYIPYKGAVLNRLSCFWFETCRNIVQNHFISMPDPNVTVGKNANGINIEMIVRGYITGVTSTSPWGSYQKGERVIYGVQFPDGLKKNQKLPQPIITPTTHGSPSTGSGSASGHDERLTRDDILKKKLVSEDLYNQMEKTALALFAKGTEIAEKGGLILVDTKYEFGLYDGKLMQIDEMHTPDSSRFWIQKTYKEKFENGQEPENFDKEFIRLWYTKRIDPYKDKIPPMPEELIVATSRRYIDVYEKLTGKTFEAFDYPIEERIRENLKKAGII